MHETGNGGGTSLTGTARLEIGILADPTVSYASCQNNVPLLRGLSLTNAVGESSGITDTGLQGRSTPQARNRRREHPITERNNVFSIIENHPEPEILGAGASQFAQLSGVRGGKGGGHGGILIRPIRIIVSSNPDYWTVQSGRQSLSCRRRHRLP
jgi:hypothetical protein